MDARTLGRRIAAARELAGYPSTRKLADAMNAPRLGYRTLNKLEAGTQGPDPGQLLQLAEFLKPPPWLFTEEDLHAIGPRQEGDEVVDLVRSNSTRLDSIEARLDDLASNDYLRRMGEALVASRERETGSSPGSAPGQGTP